MKRVVIVGEPRSGTTLLLQLLAAQPGVAVTASKLEVAAQSFDRLGLRADQPLSPRARHILAPQMRGLSHADLELAQPTFAAWHRASMRAIDPSADVVVDRVHRPLEALVELLRVSEDLVVVFSVRDVRDVARSRAYQYAHEQVDLTLLAWLHAVEAARALRARPRFLMLRFEDVIARPAESLRPLGDLLERPLDTDRPALGTADRPFVHNSTFRDVERPFDPRARERWRDHTSEATVRYATWACARTLERLGYDASVPRVPPREQLRFARRWAIARAMFSASRLRRTLSTRLLPPLE